ncbi:unnamed protein product [Ixodes persulcatus]
MKGTAQYMLEQSKRKKEGLPKKPIKSHTEHVHKTNKSRNKEINPFACQRNQRTGLR